MSPSESPNPVTEHPAYPPVVPNAPLAENAVFAHCQIVENKLFPGYFHPILQYDVVQEH